MLLPLRRLGPLDRDAAVGSFGSVASVEGRGSGRAAAVATGAGGSCCFEEVVVVDAKRCVVFLGGIDWPATLRGSDELAFSEGRHRLWKPVCRHHLVMFGVSLARLI
jgi:hypothetical protein